MKIISRQKTTKKKIYSSGWYKLCLRRYPFAILTMILQPTHCFESSSLPVRSFSRTSSTSNWISIAGMRKNFDRITNGNYCFITKSAKFSTWNKITEEERDESDHQIWSSAVDDTIKILQKKENSLNSEQKKIYNAESIEARAKLLTTNMYLFQNGIKSATAIDWENDGKEVEIKLNSEKYESASAEADALFSSVRKLKRGSKRVNDLLEENRRALNVINELKSDLKSTLNERGRIDTTRLDKIKERLIRTSKTTRFEAPVMDAADSSKSTKTKRQRQNNNEHRREARPIIGSPASNVRKLVSPGGCTVLVGRNRRGNEYLSLSVARGDDVWMHSRGCPGAHVIIQNRRGSTTITDKCLQFGANLAIFYSDFRNEQKAEVTAAEPKHILKPRGAPLGAVKLREEWKTFVGRPDNVPDELKEARQESGKTDEYHMFDKAKHRRKTREVAQDEREKRKQKVKVQKGRN